MAKQRVWRTALVAVALPIMSSGCIFGTIQRDPVNPLGTSDLKPAQHDSSAGLVAVCSGFDAKKYPAVAVLSFPVMDAGLMNKEEAKLTVTIPPSFQRQIVERLRATNAFTRVDLVTEGAPAPTGEGLLRLEGRITRLAAGASLGDRMKTQIETSLVDAQTGQALAVTADRREAPNALFQTAESQVEESFQAMARDLVLFLERLAKGEVARAN